jgi:hypothetical protein
MKGNRKQWLGSAVRVAEVSGMVRVPARERAGRDELTDRTLESAMKRLLLLLLLTGGLCLDAVAQPTTGRPTTRPEVVTVLERGPHHKVVQVVTEEADATGTVQSITNTYTQLQTGLHYLKDNQYVESVPEIVPSPAGAEAKRGIHSVEFPVNLRAGLRVFDPSGRVLRSHPSFLAYYDSASGKQVLLAELQDCQGYIAPPNTVIYTNCMSGLRCSARFRNETWGIEQDILVLENPKPPSYYGLNDATTRLECWTETFDWPTPQITPRVLKRTPLSPAGGAMAAPDLVDERLDFGGMAMDHGTAFSLETENDRALGPPTAKRFVTIDGRTFLIEAVEYSTFESLLNTLPAAAEPPAGEGTPPKESGALRLPPPVREAKTSPQPMQLAYSGILKQSGLVIDYTLLNPGLTNYTLKCSDTYYSTGLSIFYGTTIIEGGAVVKYSTNQQGYLAFWGPMQCRTSEFRPFVCTAADDDTVGSRIDGSTGTPSGQYALVALEFGGSVLSHLRIAYAVYGMRFGWGASTISHLQMTHCSMPIALFDSDLNLKNGLFFDSGTIGNCWNGNQAGTISGEHLTINAASRLSDGGISLHLTNSIVVGVGDTNYCSGQAIAFPASAASTFQSVRAGYHYLTAASPFRNAGTTNINAALASDLKRLTTYPPVEPTTGFTANTVLGPIVPRDTDQPDLGYHYDPLDYVWSGLTLNNATLVLTNGVAIGFYGTRGLDLQAGAVLVSEGAPDRLNTMVHPRSVQEQWQPISYYANEYFWQINGNYNPRPKVQLRFTQLAVLADPGYRRSLLDTTWSTYPFDSYSLTDCQLSGIADGFCPSDGLLRTVTLTNNLFQRVSLTVDDNIFGTPSPVRFIMRNNTVVGGLTQLRKYVSGTNWQVYDNFFYDVDLRHYGDAWINNDNNGYTRADTVLSGGVSNVVLSAFTFGSGPLGDYYQVATDLRDRGNRTADQAGLYHHTTRQDQVIEGISLVDIGFHYLATVPNAFDATGGYSGVQGLNNWYYRYAPLLGLPAGNLEGYADMGWGWAWQKAGDYYCLAWSNGQHPGATLDSVRTFMAPRNGPISIASQAINDYPGGDGVRVRVLKDQQTLVDWMYIPNSPTVYPINLNKCVNAGDTIDFQVNCYGNNSCDTTFWGPIITYLNPPLRDHDSDGVPDYLEDRNGNGLVDAGESNWRVADNPTRDSSSLKVFTPLK